MGKRVIGKQEKERTLHGWLFVSPFIVGFLVFFAGPMLFSAYLSLNDWPVLGVPTFVGLRNYIKMFQDDLFYKSMRITMIYTLFSVPLNLVVGLLLAMLLNQNIKAQALFRTLYYVPAMVTGVGLAVLWWMMFNTEYGLINLVLGVFGVDRIPWLTSTRWVLPAFIIMSIWQVGGGMVIYLAGLQGIPTELYEAAKVDGAGGIARFFNITIPMLSPVLLFNLVLGVIGSFQIFTNALIMTGGGPSQASLFYVLYIYRNAWMYNQMGYAASLSWGLFLVILIVVIVIFRTTSSRVYYASTNTRGNF